MTADTALLERLPLGLRTRLALEAAETGLTPAEIVAEALAEHFRRTLRARARSGRSPSDERLLAPLRSLVAQAIDGARDWDDLARRLARHDLAYRPSGGGLVLVRGSTGRRLAKGSDCGPRYAELIRKFRAPFPGHGQVALAARVLAPPPAATPPGAAAPGFVAGCHAATMDLPAAGAVPFSTTEPPARTGDLPA